MNKKEGIWKNPFFFWHHFVQIAFFVGEPLTNEGKCGIVDAELGAVSTVRFR